MAALAFHPRILVTPALAASVWFAVGFLACSLLRLQRAVVRTGRRLYYEFLPVKAHYVQLAMHSAIYVYWGAYWPRVYRYLPLLAIQVVFVYLVDMLVCWSRRDKWVLGFGAFPVVLSTNLFLWFKDDWFGLQLLMLLIAVVCKEFIKWNRDGRLTHIFNPSAIGLFIISLGFLLTHSTGITWGGEIADTLRRPPHIYVELFLIGLIVQWLFGVTLMTLSAAATLLALNLSYTALTGLYYFVDTGISVSLFLGLHLLITDPATSPRSSIGKLMFGSLYGIAVFATYGVLGVLGTPLFYDKLLAVPVLNLTVRALDRHGIALAKRLRTVTHFALWSQRRWNFAHMGVWAILFVAMLSSGFLGLVHPGQSVEFWCRACEQKKSGTPCSVWLGKLGVDCRGGTATACLILGEALDDGRLVAPDRVTAGKAFSRGCELGSASSCEGLAAFMRGTGGDILMRSCDRNDGISCFVLASMYLAGHAVLHDPGRALQLFARSCAIGWAPGCGQLGEHYLRDPDVAARASMAVRYLRIACRQNYAPSCFDLGLIYSKGIGVVANADAARRNLRHACSLGVQLACRAGERTE